eukprot:TRINITY_DN9411_c0_g1_i1.p1 TRINITY_DN9411_c0_g1~~TRINITY_DN9411_c0_g1_i1.p1  ORF type:complete len:262 (-),score=66.24 TRINITY_DN9411_c0_g1_i1:66-851(-)
MRNLCIELLNKETCMPFNGWHNRESTSTNYQTILHCVCQLGYFDIVLYLLGRNDVNPNPLDNWLRTPLHYSSMMGHVEICRKLVEIGNADPHAKDKSGRSCYDYGFTLKRKKTSTASSLAGGPGRKSTITLESASWLPPAANFAGAAASDACNASAVTAAVVVQDENIGNHQGSEFVMGKPQPPPGPKFVTSRRICAFCSKKRDTCRMCGQCMKVWYCDEKCQKNHWVSHKKNCKPVPSTSVTNHSSSPPAQIEPEEQPSS